MHQRAMSSDDLSREEIDALMHSLIRSIGTDDKDVRKYQEEYLKKLIREKKRVRDLSPKQVEFIAKYINHKMLVSKLKELGYSSDEIHNYIYVGEEEEGLGGFQYEYSIYINRNSFLTEDIPSLIQVVCHETEHSIQELEVSKNPNSKTGFDFAVYKVLKDYFYSEKGYDYYHDNYRFEQIEQDAENEGFNRAIRLLRNLGFTIEANKLQDKYREKREARRFEYDYRTDESGKKCTREEFFFNSLNSAIKRSPDILNNFPSLLALYTPGGKPKSFEELASSEFSLGDDKKDRMVEDFCKYYISKGELDKLDLSKFSEEKQANIASRLISILIAESNKIITMGNQVQYFNNFRNLEAISENNRRGVELFRLKTSRNIMRFMNRNYRYFMSLQEKGKFTSTIDMEYYDGCAMSFQHNSMYDGLAYNKTEHIEQMKELGRQAVKEHTKYRKNKQQDRYNQTSVGDSLDSLVSSTTLSGFQQATQKIKGLVGRGELSVSEEEKHRRE